MGTSSGALIGAMWWSGMPLEHIAKVLTGARPLSRIGLHPQFWRGVFTMAPLVDQLRAMLPSTFEGLQRPFAVGVTDASGTYRLLTTGPLPEAVAASCAMPRLFHPVRVGRAAYVDGGASDRLGLASWRQWRGDDRAGVIHKVDRTAGQDVPSDLRNCRVVQSPRARANFFSLKDFGAQAEQSRRRALAGLQGYAAQ